MRQEMKKLKFMITEAKACKAILRHGFTSMSVVRSASQRTQPRIVYINTNTGQRLMIGSKSIDYADREELNVLVFELNAEGSRFETPLLIDKSFSGPNTLMKLVYRDDEVEAESGIEITSKTGKTMTIMAGDMPYALAIKGVDVEGEYDFLPELDFSAYTRIPW